MVSPIRDVAALARLPKTALEDLSAIRDALTSVARLEAMVGTIVERFLPVADEVHELRDTVIPQERRVEHLESMVVELSRRTAVIEQAVLSLTGSVDRAIEHLPEPDDGRGPLAKARQVISGD